MKNQEKARKSENQKDLCRIESSKLEKIVVNEIKSLLELTNLAKRNNASESFEAL